MSQKAHERISDAHLQKMNEKYLLQADLALHEGRDHKSVMQAYNNRIDALEMLQDYSGEAL
ncbi:hypothetical protein BGP75_22200 [Motiliproteus sp. MSK22-1]|nr:hypothetical protein BGP75_22200 [Motiliproteus sp. MSK22-1]